MSNMIRDFFAAPKEGMVPVIVPARCRDWGSPDVRHDTAFFGAACVGSEPITSLAFSDNEKIRVVAAIAMAREAHCVAAETMLPVSERRA